MPFVCEYSPVNMTARLGLHEDTAANACVNNVPRAASRSISGVRTDALP